MPSAAAGPKDPRPRDRLAASTLSVDLPWLYVDGNRVAALDGTPVVLRGVTIGALDAAEPVPDIDLRQASGLSDGVLDMAAEWGANAVRVPLNRGRVLGGLPGWMPSDYLEQLDAVVSAAAQRGMWTVLSLARLDDSGVFGTVVDRSGQRVVERRAPQPDYDSIGMWRLLGERYVDEPAVLFDLYASPRPAHPDDISGFRGDWETWTLWARLAIADLRRTHPRAVCLVTGHSSGTDVTGLPLLGTADRPIPNLIYGIRLTPHQAPPWPAVTALAARHPVVVTEWGTDGAAGLGWAERTAELLRGAGLGWFACDVRFDKGPPAAPGSTPFPDRFGDVVRRALAFAVESPWAARRSPDTSFNDSTLRWGHGRW